MLSTNITTAQLNSLISTLKKANRLGSSLLYHNDIIEVLENNPKVKGKHYVLAQGILENIGNVVYIMRNIKTVIDSIECITGRKTSITYNTNVDKITITISDIEYVLFELYENYEIDTYRSTNDIWDDNKSIPVSRDDLEVLKNNGLLILGQDDTFARLAKNKFPEIISYRNITFSMQFFIIEENDSVCRIFIKVNFEKEYPIIHAYGFIKYKKGSH